MIPLEGTSRLNLYITIEKWIFMQRFQDSDFCVYILRFKNYHKVYVGSTLRWKARPAEHLRHLRRNCHINRYLQRAANKYGINNIYFEILEFHNHPQDLSPREQLQREQFWIDSYRATDKRFGFNLVKDVTSLGTRGLKLTIKQRKRISEKNNIRFSDINERNKISRTIEKRIQETNGQAYGGFFKTKQFKLINPNGHIVVIDNLCAFARNNNLIYALLYDVAIGKRIEYNGWKRVHNHRHMKKQFFKFISPVGKIVEIFGLRQFCKEHNLSYRTMCNIHNEHGNSCRGWHKFYKDGTIKLHKGKNFIITNPQEIDIIGNNLLRFCKDNELSFDMIRNGYPSKGWKFKHYL